MSALLSTARRFVVMPWKGGYRLYDIVEERFVGEVWSTHRAAVFAAKRWNAA